MTTAVDTNILLDVLAGSLIEAQRADAALVAAKKAGGLCVSTICYAEVSRNFASIRDADEFFDSLSCRIDRIEREGAFLAGLFYEAYRQRGGKRDRILSDFLIAAHAQLNADRILTRDDRFFGSNFPRLKAIRPQDLG